MLYGSHDVTSYFTRKYYKPYHYIDSMLNCSLARFNMVCIRKCGCFQWYSTILTSAIRLK